MCKVRKAIYENDTFKIGGNIDLNACVGNNGFKMGDEMGDVRAENALAMHILHDVPHCGYFYKSLLP